MQLARLTIANFKNILSASLEFSPKINCIVGNNGMGKSNLLDAVYALSFTKSFTGLPDAMVINRGEEFMMVRGEYLRGDTPEELHLGVARGRRKSLRRGGKEYQRLSEHIGLFPLVIVSPCDIDILRGPSEERRRWMDIVISQSDSVYLGNLIRYNRQLDQRNRMLRDGLVDPNLYAAVEIQMEISARYIADRRRRFVGKFSPMVSRFHSLIAGDGAEQIEVAYAGWDNGDGAASLTAMLDTCRRRDEIVRHTGIGPHRDDLTIMADGLDLRKVGSQGQCKTFTIALRLAQYAFLAKATGLKPLLLLDDIFDKLDAGRVERIISLATSPEIGQIFITDTNRTHLDEIIARTGGDHRMWTAVDGRFIPDPGNGQDHQ
ncbi:MAG: DNA replication and repair protein RecF [Clostridium sp.]|nr:DNA replication and repair protein RecF [Clostridium sp.]